MAGMVAKFGGRSTVVLPGRVPENRLTMVKQTDRIHR